MGPNDIQNWKVVSCKIETHTIYTKSQTISNLNIIIKQKND